VWKDLLLAAKRYRALAPWRWMGDRDLFGVLDPETDQIGWCCVIGAAGELFGLLLYRGDEGFDFLRRMVSGEELRDEVAFGQDALVLAFVDRGELSAEQRAAMGRSGVRFRGRGEWPQLESHGRGRLPVPPKEPEVRRMRIAIEQAIEIASRARDEPTLLETDRDGRLLIRIPSASPDDEGWVDARRAPPPPIQAAIPDFDRVRAERIGGALSRVPARWECDLFPMQAVIAERGRQPYAPAVFLLADARSGIIVHTDMTEPAGRHRWAQDQLMQAAEAVGALPSVLLVKSPDLERVLRPVATALGIRVEVAKRLRAVDSVREGFAQMTTRGGRPQA